MERKAGNRVNVDLEAEVNAIESDQGRRAPEWCTMQQVTEGPSDVPPDAVPLRDPETEEQRRDSLLRLNQMGALVEQWTPLLSDPIVPTGHSSLAGDDTVWPDYPASMVAWSGIRSAIDSLELFFRSLSSDASPSNTGHRALARSALTGAAQAVFVLFGDRPARTGNALRCAYDDLEAYERALQDLRAARWPGDAVNEDDVTRTSWDERFVRLEKRRSRLFTAAAGASLSRTQLRKSPTFREMVDYAPAHVPDNGGLQPALRLTLAQLNAAAHAQNWATLLGATHYVETPEGLRARVLTTATDLVLIAGGAMTLMPYALERFQRRAAPPG